MGCATVSGAARTAFTAATLGTVPWKPAVTVVRPATKLDTRVALHHLFRRVPLLHAALLWTDPGRSYHRISRINDTGVPSYRSPNMCKYNPTNRTPTPKKDPERILMQGPLRTSYTSGRIRVRRQRVERPRSDSIQYRHTDPAFGVMVWTFLRYSTRKALFSIVGPANVTFSRS
ncbi:hypothetical protein TNCV_2231581 [Trichonephila clavipes]|nr:hypothetical protein TNCV_2231581 [Trichonephila clavipes]